MKLNGKSIVVTGASSGMGKAIVERFAKEGANIIAVARRKERLEELAMQFGVMSIPTLVVMEKGEIISKALGARPKKAILNLL